MLVLETLNERGAIQLAQAAKEAPHVLSFPAEVVLDGRTLERPVNYLLVRIVPPADVTIDPAKPPIVVVDPRAGHGPGIGGMKPESEIGVALRAGHAVYFVGFLPKPVAGQTIEDVCRAEAVFLEEVAKRCPEAEGKPIVIANCQAGWQVMMMAAVRPELAGVIMLAGTPLSYWAGVRGKNPMRYLGGTLGGAWLTALAGDMGAGTFDGANLIANFESLNPANTYWTKPYNVYSKVDSETERFLEFETWWGSPVLLNAGEMQWIADNLFVGNKLSAGEIRTANGVRIDLRAIKSPIVCFCSEGDDITPPQQALDWILDLYDDASEIVVNGQTIVYSLHPSIGHLGIFVSGKVAAKEHREFVTCMEMIEATPPGLYEAVISEVGEDTANRDLVDGKYLFRLEPRTLDDIRAFGANSPEDDKRFAAVARLSEINLGLYRTFAEPMIRASVTEPMAEAARAMHPNRLRFALFSDKNPFLSAIKPIAEEVRASRKPVSADNPWLAAEKQASSWIIAALENGGKVRDAMTEAFFLTTYGSPLLQALVGLGAPGEQTPHRIERDRRAGSRRGGTTGGPRPEIRARRRRGGGLTRTDPCAPARRRIRRAGLPDAENHPRDAEVERAAEHPAISEMLNEQLQLLLLDEERAIAAVPKLLETGGKAQIAAGLDALRQLVGVAGVLDPEGERRFARVESLFRPKRSKRRGDEIDDDFSAS